MDSSSSKPMAPTNAQYRIGDYARYMGVTPDFLKHYEQFRLVTSEQRSNGYRYYPFSQSYKILESMRLRSYGMSLRDIDAVLVDDDMDTVISKLDERAQALQRRIAFEEAVLREHRALCAWYERMKERPADWFVAMSEEMLFLPHTSERNFLKDERIYNILDVWLAHLPMVKSSMRFAHADSLQVSEYAWGLLVSTSDAEQFGLPINDAVLRLPPRKTFYYHFIGEDWLKKAPDARSTSDLKEMSDKLAQLGLTATGDIHMTMHMYTHINSDTKRYGYYAVPID